MYVYVSRHMMMNFEHRNGWGKFATSWLEGFPLDFCGVFFFFRVLIIYLVRRGGESISFPRIMASDSENLNNNAKCNFIGSGGDGGVVHEAFSIFSVRFFSFGNELLWCILCSTVGLLFAPSSCGAHWIYLLSMRLKLKLLWKYWVHLRPQPRR